MTPSRQKKEWDKWTGTDKLLVCVFVFASFDNAAVGLDIMMKNDLIDCNSLKRHIQVAFTKYHAINTQSFLLLFFSEL